MNTTDILNPTHTHAETCDATNCTRAAQPGSIFCAECDREDREVRASNIAERETRHAAEAAARRSRADTIDEDLAYHRALAVAYLDGRRQPTLAEVALHRVALHDEFVARMAAQRAELVEAVGTAQRMDAWVASKAVA